MYYFFFICTKIYSFFCPLLNSVVLKGLSLVPCNPEDKEFVDECVSRYNVSKSVAYDDLCVIKAVLPNITKASRDYHRWMYNEMILENLLGMCLRLLSDCLRHLHGLAV